MVSLRDSAIRLTLKARDLLSGVIRKSADSLGELDARARDLKTELKALERQDRLLTAFRKQVTTVRDSNRAYREAQNRVVELARAYSKTAQPSNRLQQQLASARKTVSALNDQYGQQRNKLAELRRSLEKQGLSNRNLTGQQASLQQKLKTTAEAYQSVSRKARTTRETLRRNRFRQTAADADNARQSIHRLSGSFLRLVTAASGLYLLKRSLTGILETGDRFERLRIQLNAIMGSIEAGGEATIWIREFTRNTPLQLQQVTEAFVTLKNFGLDPMDGTLQALVDVNSKLGGSYERLQRISLALGQAWGKQKLQGEELRQLIEAGVPVWELLANVTGRNVTELRKLSEQGKLGTDVIRGLITEIGRSSSGAAAANMQLLSGYVSNLKDRWEEFKNAVAESGWLDYVNSALATLSSKLDTLDKDGRLQALAKAISDSFIAMAEGIRGAFEGITLDDFVERVRQGFTRIAEQASGIVGAFRIIGNTISVFFNSFTLVVKGAATFISGALAQITQGVADVLEVFDADELAQKTRHFSEATREVMSGFARETAEDAKQIRTSLDNMASAFTGSQRQIQQAAKKTATTVKSTNDNIQQSNEQTAESTSNLYSDMQSALDAIDASETSAELADIGVILARSYNEQKLSAEDYQSAAEKLKDKLKALKEAAKETSSGFKSIKSDGGDAFAGITQSAGDAQSITGMMANHINGITTELHAMSPAAEAAFQAINAGNNSDAIRNTGDEIAILREQLGKAQQKAQALSQSMGHLEATGISDWFKETAIAAEVTKAKFLEQKITFEELMQAWRNGELTAQSFTRQASSMGNSLNLLNEADLGALNSALAQAKQQMDALNDSTRNTLESLQNELDQLRGNTGAVEKRNFEQRNRELEAELNDARQKGDAESINNLEKSLRLNRQVYNEKRRQLSDEKNKERRREQEQSPSISQPPLIPARPPQQANTNTTPEKIIRLEYPGGQVDVGIRDSDEMKLLKALETAGMRSI